MKKLLIVVDYQKDFVDGALGFSGAELLAEPIAQKIKAYRAGKDEVVFTMDTHGTAYLRTQEGANLPVPHCVEGTEGWRLYPPIQAEPGEQIFCKQTFGSDTLFDYLRANAYTQIELVGLVSSICVISNAILAKTAQPETPIVIDTACTAGFDIDLHRAALQVMEGLQIKLL